jgi:alpha-tubulin suppressor-like RCC1 family protein
MPDSKSISSISLGSLTASELWLGGTRIWPKAPLAVSAAQSWSLALMDNNTIIAPPVVNNYYPNARIIPTSTRGVTIAIDTGERHSMALLQNGTIVLWGENPNGQLNAPAGLTNIIAVRAGPNNSYAIRSNGTVAGWGANWDGVLNFSGLTNIVDLDINSLGGGHVLALKSDGTVVGFGFNGYGQCNVPAGLNRVVKVRTSQTGSLALRDDGGVVVWGSELSGVPSNLQDVADIALVDRYTAIVLKVDGTVVSYSSGSPTLRASGVAAMSRNGRAGIKYDETMVYF